MTEHPVIDGEVVGPPRVLADKPATPVVLRCDTHPAWMGCGVAGPSCVAYAATEEPDVRTWTERATTFRVRDQRRLSYPRGCTE